MTGWSFDDNTSAGGQAADGEPVVHFTPAARNMVLELLEQRGLKEKGGLRIRVKNPGFGAPEYAMGLEEEATPRVDDTLIDGGGFPVLVDAASLPFVDGASVDFFDQLLQRGFRVEPPPPPPAPPPAPRPDLDLSDPIVATVNEIIERQVNPGIASHGGHATLIDVRDDRVYVQLGGGCQGCSMVSVTLKQGIERMIKEAVPSIKEVVDTTDHAGGNNPYYAGGKGASPYETAAKG
jgi:Fe/S biogenesis protein NfuA